MNLIVSRKGSGTRAIWTIKYKKIVKNGMTKKIVFFLRNAKKRQTAEMMRKTNTVIKFPLFNIPFSLLNI